MRSRVGGIFHSVKGVLELKKVLRTSCLLLRQKVRNRGTRHGKTEVKRRPEEKSEVPRERSS